MRAVDAIMECLKAEGVEVVFGLPGGANLPTYDAFVDAGIRHILVRHEAGGGHAAEGYAKATGKVGVAFATSGPGATNVVTPIVDAMMDSVPTVFITGQVRTDLLGTDGFQETDTLGITMPVVKHSFLIRSRSRSRGRSTRPSTSRARAPGAGRRRHPGRPQPRGHRLRAGHRPAPARLPADDRGQHEADPPGREGDGLRAPPGDLRRRRRRQRQRVQGADRVRDLGPLPGHLHADGARRLPGPAPAVARHARDARHAHGELRDGRGRPDLLRRRALRRPHHRQALGVRPAREVHPHRRRPGRDLQEDPGPHPDRRRCEERPAEADEGVPRARGATGRAWTSGGRGSAAGRRSTRCATTTRPTPRSSRSS